ncbi:MAG TPA: hypothetical protein VMH26_14640 [Burkholderiales bacterium]|nr:hypothetical protein [Burkholderiales bacterium]
MSQFVSLSERPFRLDASLVSTEQQSLSASAALPLEALEHGAYYAGKLGLELAVARWHAKKRRFVFEVFALGRQSVRSVAHVADPGLQERFAPLSKTEPRDTYRVSDYAFETAA